MNLQDNHLHLPAPPLGTTFVVTHPNGAVTTISAVQTVSGESGAAKAPPSTLPTDVEDVIERHEKHGVKGTRSRDLAQALIERGWIAKAGPKYLRFIYQGSGGSKVTLYANSRDLIARENEMYAKTLPGAKLSASGVRFNYVADFDLAIDAAVSMEGLVLVASNGGE